MLVISDTTPIISLLKINRLDLLEKLFDSVLVPAAVFSELTSNERFPDEARKIKECSFIRSQQIENSQSVEMLQKTTGLDLGESEAIVMFGEANADFLLIDEKRGRKVADTMKIPHVGTVGILLQAFSEKMIFADELISCIETMRNKGIRIDDSLLEIVRKKILK